MNHSNIDSNVDLNTISVLIPQCKDGHQGARERLLVELQGFLNQVASRNLDSNLKQKLGVSDIVQSSLMRVVRHFEQFRGSTSLELRAWLKQIVVNEIHKTRRAYATEKRDIHREQTNQVESELLPGNEATDRRPTPSTQALSDERIELFYAVLSRLSPEHAEVIKLRSIDRLPFQEIGSKMSRSEDAVSKLWFRAMLKFEEELKRNENFTS